MPADDTIFGLLAIKSDLVTHEQLTSARNAQKKRQGEAAGGEDRVSLRRIMIEKGYITLDQASALDEQKADGLIPGYEIIDEIGRGGMGVVYKARQISMDRIVAIKILSRTLSADTRFTKKFVAEAKAAAKLNHGNIITAIDVGEADGLHYFVMEHVDGEEVADVIDREGRVEPDRAFDIVLQIAYALEHARSHALVHRDIKPENIMLCADGSAKLCDLGLARPIVEGAGEQKASMTEGTPYYVSPEQATGRADIDARADIYSLGATLYHMLSGEVPYDGGKAGEIMWKQVHKPFPDIRAKCPGCTEAQYAILAKMVEKDRDDRHQSPQALIAELLAARQAAVGGGATAAPARAGRRGRPAQLVTMAGALLVLVLAAVGVAVAVGSQVAAPESGDVASKGAGEAPAKPPARPSAERPQVRREDPPADPEPAPAKKDPGPTSVADAQAREAEAKQKLGDPEAARSDDPKVLAAALGRYDLVLSDYDGTAAAAVARSELPLAVARLKKSISGALLATGATVKTALEGGEFPAARKALVDTRESLGAIGLAMGAGAKRSSSAAVRTAFEEIGKDIDAASKALTIRLGSVDKAASEDMDAAIAEARKASATDMARAIELVEKALGRAIDTTRPKGQALLAELKKQQRSATLEGAVEDLRDRVFSLLASGSIDEARAAAKAGAARVDLGAFRAEVDAVVAAVDAFERTAQTFSNALVGAADPITFPLRDGTEVVGRVTDLPATGLTVDIKVHGRRDTIDDFALERLTDAFLCRCARGEKADGAARLAAGLFFAIRGYPELGLKELTAAKGAGATVSEGTLAWVRAAAETAAGRRALEAIARALALDPKERPAATVAALREAAAAAGSPAAKAVLAEKAQALRDHYVAARTAQLAGDGIGELFRGAVEMERRGGVRIVYDWTEGAELEDWTRPGAKADDASKVRLEQGRLVTDKIALQHIAMFEGDVAITVEGRSLDKRASNINLRLLDDGKGKAYLVGFGHQQPGKNKIQVDPSAPLRPGWRVTLPAAVIVRTEPKPDDWKYLFADDKQARTPTPGRDATVRAVRSRGKVVALVGRRTVATWKETPDTTPPGGMVGIDPLNATLAIERVEIEGTLAEGWIGSRAAVQAADEAAKLFGAPPSPPAPAPGAGG